MILVDTHVVVWLAFDQDRLSKKARAAIDDARQNGDGLAICDITLLELAARFEQSGELLLYRHRLRQIPWLIHVAAAAHGDVISQQLQRYDL